MEFVKQKAEIINIDNPDKIQNIAGIARVCYKSEEKSDKEQNIRLVKNLINNKHFAILEHEDYIISFKAHIVYELYCEMISDIEKCFVIKLYLIATDNDIISGNIRAWRNFYKYAFLLKKKNIINLQFIPVPKIFDNNIFFADIIHNNGFFAICIDDTLHILNKDDLATQKDILAHHRVSAKMICDRGISHEIVRHRGFSFAQESTRYVNYQNKETQFIDYSDFNLKYKEDTKAIFEGNSNLAENNYQHLIKYGNTPQIARNVLPHNLKTEIVVTGNIREWLHFFNLRFFERTGKAHPFVKDLAKQLYNEFENKAPFSKKLIESYCNEMWELENE